MYKGNDDDGFEIREKNTKKRMRRWRKKYKGEQ